MKARPILMSGPMVRANLDGRKTQTRRIVKPQPTVELDGEWMWDATRPGGFVGAFGDCWHDKVLAPYCPYGQSGDVLWVREAWTLVPASAYRMSDGVQQTADPADPDMAAIYAAGWDRSIPKWRPSIHMPRWASRLTLRLGDVWVERLLDITEQDALAEGIIEYEPRDEDPAEYAWREGGTIFGSAREAYLDLWRHLNGADSVEANPWVWVLDYKHHCYLANVEQVLTGIGRAA